MNPNKKKINKQILKSRKINTPADLQNLKIDLEQQGERLEEILKKIEVDKYMRLPISFDEFLHIAAQSPEHVFRDIFQVMHDMIRQYVPEGIDEYSSSEDSIGFVHYDFSKLFQEGCDNPFFADRLFSNRFISLIESFKQGNQGKYIYLFEGPPGSGKSTFLNNLLQKLEEFVQTDEGAMYKSFWRLDINELRKHERFELLMQKISENTESCSIETQEQRFLDISCPSNDHPILQIPKSYRKKFLEELIPDKKFLKKLFTEKEYEWVMKEIPCSICKSLYTSLLDVLGDPIKVFNMLTIRRVNYNRQFGNGISVFNPGDRLDEEPIRNEMLQGMINEILKNEEIKYSFSYLAKTNNGVLALMDIKDHNVSRLKSLHGIISDGVHKVDFDEEKIKSLFVGLINPGDKTHYENIPSFQDRIITVIVPYVLDYKTEVSIYLDKFGKSVELHFLPGVLHNFARIIIASRLNIESEVINKWITNPSIYDKYVDENMLLLKMELYTGKIPGWLNDDHIRKFDKPTRKNLIIESESEGVNGFSGRQSLNLFSTFLTKYMRPDKMITMDMVTRFFAQKDENFIGKVPDGFMESLESMYEYDILQEVKESIYYYNEKQISKDIQNYLYSINFEPIVTEKCSYTDEIIEITEEFFTNFEVIILGSTSPTKERKAFRRDVQSEYISKTLVQEIRMDGKKITDTELYHSLFEKYTKNLKENALAPYTGNDSFRRAIMDFGTSNFNAYDERLQRDVKLLLSNLKNKFKYSTESAKQVSLYVLDKNLVKKY